MHWCRSAGRAIRPCLVVCTAGISGHWVQASAPADLSLGVRAAETSDLQLSRDGESSADVLAHYSTALQFEAAGKLRQALEHYLAVFQADPTNAELAAHTAGIAMQFQGRAAALKILEDAVRAGRHSPAPLLNLARFCNTYPPEDLFEKDERPAKAMAEALTRFPLHAEVYEAAVLIHLIQNQREQAIAVMNQAANQTSRDPQFWLAAGRTAERVWPLGQAEFATEYRQRVTPFFENALDHVSKDDAEQVTLEVAQHYLLTNDLDRARQHCEKLVTAHDSLNGRKLLYRLYIAAEQPDKALATLEAVVKQDPADAEQQRLLANEYTKREELEKAIPPLEAAIQHGGGEINDYLKLGSLLGRTRQFEAMVRLGQRSVQLFPEQPTVHYQLAFAHRARQEWAASVRHFAETEKLAASAQTELLDHQFYYQYGATLERAEQYADAARKLEKSISITPREESEVAANTMNSLGYMWLEQGLHLDKAGELIIKANELHPDQAMFIDSLGWFHYKKGNYPAALKELQRAETLLEPIAPEDAEILEHIALTHQALGDKAKARDYLERAQKLNTSDAKAKKRIEETLKKLQSGKTDTEKK